jgi:hypothetical protein
MGNLQVLLLLFLICSCAPTPIKPEVQIVEKKVKNTHFSVKLASSKLLTIKYQLNFVTEMGKITGPDYIGIITLPAGIDTLITGRLPESHMKIHTIEVVYKIIKEGEK